MISNNKKLPSCADRVNNYNFDIDLSISKVVI